jgi:Rrf2 family protein
MSKNIKISEKTHLAVKLLTSLAENKNNKPLSLGEIAIKEGISFYFLQKIGRLLKTYKLVKSSRGSQGGYQLTKSPNQISLKEICEAVEGPISLINCSQYKFCQNRTCQSRSIWQKVNKQIEKALSQTKLSDIV